MAQDRYLRLAADLENTKKRLARAAARDVEAQKEGLLRDVLPVADALDLAVMHASQDEDSRSILQGIDLIRDMLTKFFTKYDVTVIEAWGEPFDPRWHEALGMIRHPKLPPNTVSRVGRKGFRGNVLKTSLTEDKEEKLREVLAGMSYRHS